MPDRSKKSGPTRTNPEHRTSPRYRLPSPPEVEILHLETGAPVKARLGDISSGGCFVETDYLPPLGTDLTVTFKKSGDTLKATAQVVRVSLGTGLALVFTSMGAEEFRTLESWMSIYVVTAWAETNRRGTHRLALEIEVRVSGYTSQGARFTEDTPQIFMWFWLDSKPGVDGGRSVTPGSCGRIAGGTPLLCFCRIPAATSTLAQKDIPIVHLLAVSMSSY